MVGPLLKRCEMLRGDCRLGRESGGAKCSIDESWTKRSRLSDIETHLQNGGNAHAIVQECAPLNQCNFGFL